MKLLLVELRLKIQHLIFPPWRDEKDKTKPLCNEKGQEEGAKRHQRYTFSDNLPSTHFNEGELPRYFQRLALT